MISGSDISNLDGLNNLTSFVGDVEISNTAITNLEGLNDVNSITGKVLVVGNCAIKEVSETLITRLGKTNVYLSSECNNICETANALFHLMKVNPINYVPGNPPKLHGKETLKALGAKDHNPLKIKQIALFRVNLY